MCYTFDLLGPHFSAEHVRTSVEAFETAVRDGWVCWAFSNHDVVRHVSRWAPRGGTTSMRSPRLSLALLSALRGSICLYQGEELGLPEAELAFEDLSDPYGIRFWPGFKGRDGCRTPMVWEAARPHGGFSTAARTWLPVPEAHLARAVDCQQSDPDSVLTAYRQALAFRREHEALRSGAIAFLAAPEPVLAFVRRTAGEALLAVFNVSASPAEWVPPASLGPIGRLDFPGAGRLVADSVVLPAYGAYFGRLGAGAASA